MIRCLNAVTSDGVEHALIDRDAKTYKFDALMNLKQTLALGAPVFVEKEDNFRVFASKGESTTMPQSPTGWTKEQVAQTARLFAKEGCCMLFTIEDGDKYWVRDERSARPLLFTSERLALAYAKGRFSGQEIGIAELPGKHILSLAEKELGIKNEWGLVDMDFRRQESPAAVHFGRSVEMDKIVIVDTPGLKWLAAVSID